MLSMLERVLTLASVGIFAGTPEEVLVEIAGMLVELEVPAGTTLFHKGDAGSSMFVIARGQVRVHDGERTLNLLGDRDVFGEMALLDPEPRVASVTALEDTLLLRIDHQPFFALLADRSEIADGIIRVLAGYLRDRVGDLARLDAEIRA